MRALRPREEFLAGPGGTGKNCWNSCACRTRITTSARFIFNTARPEWSIIASRSCGRSVTFLSVCAGASAVPHGAGANRFRMTGAAARKANVRYIKRATISFISVCAHFSPSKVRAKATGSMLRAGNNVVQLVDAIGESKRARVTHVQDTWRYFYCFVKKKFNGECKWDGALEGELIRGLIVDQLIIMLFWGLLIWKKIQVFLTKLYNSYSIII